MADIARLRRYLALMAPGTPMRDGLERIVHGRTGALVVLGNSKQVQQLCTGGFELDVAFTPTALRELAKMDGGILLSGDLERIVSAGIHLMPRADVDTLETGTRHRTADRVARQTGVPVVTVSASMSTIALFMDGQRYLLERSDHILGRASQALATLARYRERLHDLTTRLSVAEVQDQATVRDLALVLQRLEMIRRLEDELRVDIAELGIDGRLVRMQLQELTTGFHELSDLVGRDYEPEAGTPLDLTRLRELSDDELIEPHLVARAIELGEHMDARVVPRGYRQLAQVPRLPASLAPRLIEHFGGLQALFAATTAELLGVEGIGEQRARAIREGLARLAESAYDDRLR